jgi:hypothetical protein
VPFLTVGEARVAPVPYREDESARDAQFWSSHPLALGISSVANPSSRWAGEKEWLSAEPNWTKILAWGAAGSGVALSRDQRQRVRVSLDDIQAFLGRTLEETSRKEPPQVPSQSSLLYLHSAVLDEPRWSILFLPSPNSSSSGIGVLVEVHR